MKHGQKSARSPKGKVKVSRDLSELGTPPLQESVPKESP